MQYLMGLDIGTTSSRAILFDLNGQVCHTVAVEYETVYLPPNRAEQDPGAIFTAVLASVRRLVQGAGLQANQLAGMGISAAMYSIIPVDETGEALGPMLIWADGRAGDTARQIRETVDSTRLYRLTGCPVQPIYPLAKIRWLMDNQPKVFHKVAKFVSIKEYILFQFFGQYVVDWSIASATGLFNIHQMEWEPEALAAAGITASHLSQPVPPTQVLRGIKPAWASQMGIPVDLPVVIGAGDGPLANLGAGSLGRGQVNVDIGTSGAIRLISNQPLLDERQRIWCYSLAAGYWVAGGIISNAGNVLRWLKDVLAVSPYEILSQYAGEVPAGADQLIFLPFLTGERNPNWNQEARGVFCGLSLTHSRQHMVRAVMEGVVYSIYSIYQALAEIGQVSEIRATGGFAKSSLWCQIMADVLGREVKIPEVREGSALGAAILAMRGLELINDLQQAGNFTRIHTIYRPDAANHQKYQHLYGVYQEIYYKLGLEFKKLYQLGLSNAPTVNLSGEGGTWPKALCNSRAEMGKRLDNEGKTKEEGM